MGASVGGVLLLGLAAFAAYRIIKRNGPGLFLGKRPGYVAWRRSVSGGGRGIMKTGSARFTHSSSIRQPHIPTEANVDASMLEINALPPHQGYYMNSDYYAPMGSLPRSFRPGGEGPFEFTQET